MKSVNIYYNPQQGSYFKINKQTGDARKSHKNEFDLVKFKPEYSGTDYRIKKENQRDFSPKYISRPVFQLVHQHKHTVPFEKVKKQAKSIVTLAPLGNLDNHSNFMGYSSRISQSRMLATTSSGFENRLKDFCRIKEQLQKQNHSPREGYEGSLKQQKISGQYNQQIVKCIYEKKRDKKLLNPSNSSASTLSNISLKNQLTKQRQLFFRFNSTYKPQQNQRQQQELRERKTNLKILQNLFITKNNRETSFVYQ